MHIHCVWTWFAPIHPLWSWLSQHMNSNTNTILFIIVCVVLQLLTPVVDHSRCCIIIVPSFSFSCHRNHHLGPKPNCRHHLCHTVSPVEPLLLSVAAKSPLSSHVTHHSHRSCAMPDSSLHFTNLNESNYAEWSLYMRSTLIKKGLWKVVEGSETHPLGSPNSNISNLTNFLKQLICLERAEIVWRVLRIWDIWEFLGIRLANYLKFLECLKCLKCLLLETDVWFQTLKMVQKFQTFKVSGISGILDISDSSDFSRHSRKSYTPSAQTFQAS